MVDFTDSFYFDDRSILSKKGEPEIDPWGFLYPLTESVWAAVVAVLAVVWLVMMVVGHRPKGHAFLDWSGGLLLENIRVFLNQGKLKPLNYQYVIICIDYVSTVFSVARDIIRYALLISGVTYKPSLTANVSFRKHSINQKSFWSSDSTWEMSPDFLFLFLFFRV